MTRFCPPAMPSPTRTDTALPRPVRDVLWEYEPGALSWREDEAFITGRVLAAGSWKAVTWLRDRAGDDALRDWILTHRGRGLSPRQLRFWQLVLDLPARRVDAWIERRRTSPWEQRAQ